MRRLGDGRWFQRPSGIAIIGFVILLVLALLWMPPVDLGNRLFHRSVPRLSSGADGLVEHPIGARLEIPADAVTGDMRVSLEALDATGTVGMASADSLIDGDGSGISGIPKDADIEAALAALPAGTRLFSPIYRVQSFGDVPAKATLTMPVPAEIERIALADVYAWNGHGWQWQPAMAVADSTSVQTQLTGMPALVALGTPVDRSLQVNVGVDDQPTADGQTVPDRATVAVWKLDADGGLVAAEGAPTTKPASTIASLSNETDEAGLAAVAQILASQESAEAHARAIADRVKAEGFAGVELAYRGTSDAQRANFTNLVTTLKAMLPANAVVAVRTDAPTRSGGQWQTGAFDWTALGKVADQLRVPLPADPAAFVAGGPIDSLLSYAVANVERSRVVPILSTYAHDAMAEEIVPITYAEALELLIDNIAVEEPTEYLTPGETLRLSKDPEDTRDLQVDPATQVNWFAYRDSSDETHTVWMETANSVVRKLQLLNNYLPGGALLEGALTKGNDGSILPLVAEWQQAQPAAPNYMVHWQVEDTEGNIFRSVDAPLQDGSFAWVVPERPGLYEVSGSLSDGLGTEGVMVTAMEFTVPTPTYTPTPEATSTPEPTATPVAEEEEEETPEATATEEVTPTETPEETVTEEATPTEEVEPTATPEPTSAPMPVAPPAGRTGSYFGYGIQAHIYGGDAQIYGLIQGMGFNWIKQQVEWKLVEPSKGDYQWGDLDRIVGGANAAGLNVLLSVVKAPAWARGGGADMSVEGPPANPQDFADFLAALASRYRGQVKAYEVWNEQNLHYEWGNEPLSAARYVELLSYAFVALKNADPGATVVSGALTPTGMNDGVIAIDDRAYLEQMYRAGLARYCDAVGVHPSGYNNPPDADWRTWSDPSAPTFKGHPSFFFRGTMEGYRNIMVAYGDGGKRLWPTEFGWSTFENLGASAPAGYEYANQNTEEEQAAWLVGAFQMARAWGWVGPMFVWNLNFAPASGPGNEKAGFGILRADWSPRPAYSALQAMPK